MNFPKINIDSIINITYIYKNIKSTKEEKNVLFESQMSQNLQFLLL